MDTTAMTPMNGTGVLHATTRRVEVLAGHLADANRARLDPGGVVGERLRGGWGEEACFDVGAMTRLLDHDNHDMRHRFRAFARRHLDLFLVRHDIPLHLERQLALQRTPSPLPPPLPWRTPFLRPFTQPPCPLHPRTATDGDGLAAL